MCVCVRVCLCVRLPTVCDDEKSPQKKTAPPPPPHPHPQATAWDLQAITDSMRGASECRRKRASSRELSDERKRRILGGGGGQGGTRPRPKERRDTVSLLLADAKVQRAAPPQAILSRSSRGTRHHFAVADLDRFWHFYPPTPPSPRISRPPSHRRRRVKHLRNGRDAGTCAPTGASRATRMLPREQRGHGVRTSSSAS